MSTSTDLASHNAPMDVDMSSAPIKCSTSSADDPPSAKRLKGELSDEEHKQLDQHMLSDLPMQYVMQSVLQFMHSDSVGQHFLYAPAFSVVDRARKVYPDKFTVPPHSNYKDLSDLAMELIKREDGRNAVNEGMKSGKWKDWCILVMQEINTIQPMETEIYGDSSPVGAEATISSWNEEFVGRSHEVLEDTIHQYTSQVTDSKIVIYARVISIVQSSGTGKSRMVDELAKSVIVISINTRPELNSGFPAADHDVREFFESRKTKEQLTSECHKFLISLFKTTFDYISNIDKYLQDALSGIGAAKQPVSLPEKIRFLMTHGQTFESQGVLRSSFYRRVIEGTKDLHVPNASESSSDATIGSHIFKWRGKVISLRIAAQDLLGGITDDAYIDKHIDKHIVLAFDEAHGIITSALGQQKWTAFHSLRQALHDIVNLPITSLVLSTAGKIHEFLPPSYIDPSTRLQNASHSLLPAFTALGFDQMCPEVSPDTHTMSEISSIDWMVQFGRPLFGSRHKHDHGNIRSFAAVKLLGGKMVPDEAKMLDEGAKLACLSVRLALDFTATTLSAWNEELKQVENHMRLCITINKGKETAITIAPSEPILAEASLLITNSTKLDLPRTLQDILQGPSLDKGDRGELICLLLWTLARDKTPKSNGTKRNDQRRNDVKLVDLIDTLLAKIWHDQVHDALPTHARNENEGKVKFHLAFKDARVHFNHFIKINDTGVVNRTFLWPLIARGAAILCANNQAGIDVIIPFLYDDGSKLGRETVSAFIIQVKNNAKYSSSPDRFLFDDMNPYSIGMYDMNETNPLPVIRMVFALAATKATVTVVQEPKERTLRSRVGTSKKFTSYDIWCAQTSSATFDVIAPSDERVYDELLQIYRKFPRAYEPVEGESARAEELKKQMHPGSGVDLAHWNFVRMDQDSVRQKHKGKQKAIQ